MLWWDAFYKWLELIMDFDQNGHWASSHHWSDVYHHTTLGGQTKSHRAARMQSTPVQDTASKI